MATLPKESAMAVPKILVVGAIEGKLQAFFSKLSKLHSQHNFSFAIVVGNLFASEDDESLTSLLSGKIEVPVTTYFTVGTRALPPGIVEKITNNESEICPNLLYLNKRSTIQTSEGVRIVTLGGILDPEVMGGDLSKDQHLPYHTSADAKALRGANTADILLTAVWPAQVWKGSSLALPFDIDAVPTSDDVADLCSHLKPRYHFCPSAGSFTFEREPFFHAPPDPSTDPPVTRFVSLAPFGNKEKAKTIHAFEIKAPGPIPSGSTVSPFLAQSNTSRKRPAPSADAGFSRFGDSYGQGRPNNRRRGRGGHRLPPPGPDVCFFCLGRNEAESHMVCSIGEDAYLATAKGPLTTASTFSEYGLNYPAHMIITPQAHMASIKQDTMGQAAQTTFKEMTRFREALQATVSQLSKQKLGAVTWEINRGAAGHVHWQFVPVPAHLISNGLGEAACKAEAANLKLPGLEAKDFGLADEVPGDYVRFWIWHEEDGEDGGRIVSKCLLMRFDEDVQRFDLQYPRKVMAKLLGLENRTVWRNCTQEAEEEERDTSKFREAFKPWDFTWVD